MATKETRAAKRQKKLEAQNVRRRARGQRRAYRLLARYERRIEATNDRIQQAISRQKGLIAEWRSDHRSAIQAIREGLADGTSTGDSDSGEADSGLEELVDTPEAVGESGRVLPDSPEPGGGSNSGDGGSGLPTTEGTE